MVATTPPRVSTTSTIETSSILIIPQAARAPMTEGPEILDAHQGGKLDS